MIENSYRLKSITLWNGSFKFVLLIDNFFGEKVYRNIRNKFWSQSDIQAFQPNRIITGQTKNFIFTIIKIKKSQTWNRKCQTICMPNCHSSETKAVILASLCQTDWDSLKQCYSHFKHTFSNVTCFIVLCTNCAVFPEWRQTVNANCYTVTPGHCTRQSSKYMNLIISLMNK